MALRLAAGRSPPAIRPGSLTGTLGLLPNGANATASSVPVRWTS